MTPIDNNRYSSEDSIPQIKKDESEKYQRIVDEHLKAGGTITQVASGVSGEREGKLQGHMNLAEKRCSKSREQEKRRAAASFERSGAE